MQLIHDYRNDEGLRKSFNELAVKVFGLDFENWYKNGFWQDNYTPYSIVEDGKVVSNVSVNTCNMNYRGKIVRLIQLGTVMTDPEYRGRGYARILMEQIIKDYEDKVDGIYLWGNDSVVDFYPKFGFKSSEEYQFSKAVDNTGAQRAEPVPMSSKTDWDKMVSLLENRPQNSAFYMVGNTGLYMFYLSQFMQESVFRIGPDDYAIAEIDGYTLLLHTIIGDADIDQVIAAFGSAIKRVVLCFTPNETAGFKKSICEEEDRNFFVRGRFFEETNGDEYMFQEISHA